MKKALAFILAAVMVFSLTSCKKELTKEQALENYQSFFKKLSTDGEQDTQYDVDMKIDMKMNMNGDEMDASTTGNIKFKSVGGKIEYYSKISVDVDEIVMCYDGEKTYYAINGEKIEVDEETFKAEMGQSVDFPEINNEMLKSFKAEPDGKNTKVTFTVDGTKMTDLTESIMGDLADMVNDFSSFDVIVVVIMDNKGNCKSMKMDFDVEMSIEGVKISSKASFEYIFNKIGSGVEVDLSLLSA